MNSINNYEYDEIKKILDRIDKEDSFGYASEPDDQQEEKFKNELNNYLSTTKDTECSILGIDIYKYSKFDYEKQKLIPFIFSLLINEANRNFLQYESFLNYGKKQLEQEMIHTGDGGFLIFRNPIEAVLFVLFFNIYVHLFNSFHVYPNLRKHIGPITVRYAITYDRLYKINSKFYGPAIIKNARIISKDRLNRFLIDDKSYTWFLMKTNGIENIPIIRLKELKHIFIIDEKLNEGYLLEDSEKEPGIQHVFCQKLGNINVKEDDFDIYNLTIQSIITVESDDGSQKLRITSTAGNMNCNGF